MPLEEDAYYDFAAKYLRFTPLNDDLTIPTPDNIIGGVGPFDMTDATVIGAVPIITKIDSAAAIATTIDLSGASVQSAVTAAEMFAAINTATITGVTASLEAVTNRLKIVFATGAICQIYGEAAEFGLIGRGYGMRVLTTQTFKSFTDNPLKKDPETFTSTDINGSDVEVVTDGFRKGTNGTIVEAADDFLLKRLMTGGTIAAATGKYTEAVATDQKFYFKTEVFWAQYKIGLNKEMDLSRYIQQTIYSCVGNDGDTTRDRNFSDATYNYTATPYKVAGVVQPDSDKLPLTIAKFLALDIENVSA